MSDTILQRGLFTTLKKVLKQKNVTYAELAARLQVSELTVKRMFRDQDCKFSRLLAVCKAIEVSFEELLEMQERNSQKVEFLPLEIEEQLAKRPAVFSFLILLISRFDLEYIRTEFNLAQHEIYRYLRELETMGILTLQGDSYRFQVSPPIRWRLGGPVGKIIIKANQVFVEHSIDRQTNEEVEVVTQSRLLSPASLEELQEELRNLAKRFNTKAAQDQLLHPAEQLIPVKMLGIVATFPVAELFPVPPYAKPPNA